MNHTGPCDTGRDYLSKLPDNCPVCGGRIEECRLGVRSKDGTAEMQLRITGLRALRAAEMLSPESRLRDFEAMRCPTCRIVMFSYTKEVEFGRP